MQCAAQEAENLLGGAGDGLGHQEAQCYTFPKLETSKIALQRRQSSPTTPAPGPKACEFFYLLIAVSMCVHSDMQLPFSMRTMHVVLQLILTVAEFWIVECS